jgi:hypothetical protein
MISRRYDEYKYTGSGAISQTIAPGGGEFRLAGFMIHANLGFAAESITFTLDSQDGSAYDHELASVSVSGLTDKVYMIPADERCPLKDKDEIDIALTNASGRTYGLKVFIERE